MVLLAALLAGNGCKKKEPEKIITGNPAGSLSMQIDGKGWSADGGTLQASGNNLIVTGSKMEAGNLNDVWLLLRPAGSANNFILDSARLTRSNVLYTADTGEVTMLIRNGKETKGTFSFVAGSASGTKTVTGGTFDFYQ